MSKGIDIFSKPEKNTLLPVDELLEDLDDLSIFESSSRNIPT
jgi:hypothetical protein